MPVVSYLRTVPLPDGSTGPAAGKFRFKPVQRRVVAGSPDNVVVPAVFPAPLVAGVVTVTLAPGPWRVTEAVDGVPDETYTIVVPDDPGPLEGDGLARVDPSTLTPQAVPVAAWWAVADATITDASISGDDLVLTRHDRSTVNAGRVTPTPAQLAAAVEATARPSNLDFDTDGVPFISPGVSTAFLYTDTDGTPYFNT